MADLPVRAMVLYKHGVGFFTREGTYSGDSLALTFKADAINDVLKSLAVFDHAGGAVLGIHYQTPMDRLSRAANSSVNLSDQHTLADLLRGLRGRAATLTYETKPGSFEIVSGRVLGLDYVKEQERQLGVRAVSPEQMRVTVLGDNGRVYAHFFNDLRTVEIHDPQSSRDLVYFLDSSMTEDNRRTVQVRLSDGAHDLSVYYVAPSPTWRVSYRLVAESDASGEHGRALLQGWGLFDNRLEEDLIDVHVTLVAGQPISFIYDLYESHIPTRPTVKDESRVAPGPIEYEGMSLNALEMNQAYSDRDPMMAVRGGQSAEFGARKYRAAMPDQMMTGSAPDVDAAYASRAITLESAAQGAESAETKDTGETFQYIVTTPVSVKRGESALVPIVASEIKYERELLYNRAKLAEHPVAALRFANSSGLTLERGPVTVVEDGDYKGEAVITFTKDGNEVYVPYAVELGVRVTEKSIPYRTETFSLSIGRVNRGLLARTAKAPAQLPIEQAALFFDSYEIHGQRCIIENKTTKPVTVTVEIAALDVDWELYETPEPAVSTPRELRWRVDVPAGGGTEFTYQQRRRTRHQQALQSLKYDQLRQYLADRWLDQATFDALSDVLTALDAIQTAQANQTALNKERASVYEQQGQLRKNLTTLQPTGKEAALRDRVLGQLEATQDRLDAIDREMAEMQAQEKAAEAQVTRALAALLTQ